MIYSRIEKRWQDDKSECSWKEWANRQEEEEEEEEELDEETLGALNNSQLQPNEFPPNLALGILSTNLENPRISHRNENTKRKGAVLEDQSFLCFPRHPSTSWGSVF